MKTFIINGHESFINSDAEEGKGYDIHIGYFTKENDAKLSVKGKDGWG